MNRSSEKGALLILTLVVVLIVGGMVTTMLTVSVSGARREKGRDEKFKSREIAEAALDVSINNLRQATDGVDNDGDNVVDEGTTARPFEVPFGHYNSVEIGLMEGQLGRIGALNWSPANDPNGNGRPDFGEPGVVPVPFSGGEMIAYAIFSELDGLDNDGDGTIDNAEEAGALAIVALGRFPAVPVGQAPAGTEIVSLATFNGIFTQELAPPNPPLWDPNAAIATGGSLTATGGSTVLGTSGNMHANQTLTLDGNTSLTGDATATGSLVLGLGFDPTKVGGIMDGSAGKVDIPNIDPESYRQHADFQFLSTGDVVDRNNNLLGSGSYNGWAHQQDGSWKPPRNSPNVVGTVFVEGSVHMPAGTGYWNGAGTSMTLIATGDIKINSQGTFSPAYGSLFCVAGGDIRITAQTQMSTPGIILAREQVHINGGANLLGVVMAADIDNASAMVDGLSQINGGMNITYNGGLQTDIPIIIETNQYVLDPTFAAYEEN
ncbi:MAG: hypothetical protein ACYTFG_15505 [Planctomycetota bacterium]|jgi:hypothetical protein